MKPKMYFLIITVVLIITIVVFFWIQSCQKPIESIELYYTEDIIRDLDDADTPEKAELAINHLIEKASMATHPNYSQFIIDEENILQLAMAQSEYVNGNYDVSIGESYSLFANSMDAIKEMNSDFIFNCNLDSSLKDLFIAGNIAKNDIENPNNILILTIISENGQIPRQVIQYDSTKIISPVQNYCYLQWVYYKYGSFSTLNNLKSYEDCIERAERRRITLVTIICPLSSNIDSCVQAAWDAYYAEIKGCHDQGGS